MGEAVHWVEIVLGAEGIVKVLEFMEASGVRRVGSTE